MAMDFVAKPTHMLGCIALGLLISCVSCTNVTEVCSSPSTDKLCYTVSFTRSVREGHDSQVTVNDNSNFSTFSLTIFTNTEYTHLLGGYMVTVGSGCLRLKDINVTQTSSSAIGACTANMTECGSNGIQVFLPTDANAIKENVFHANLEIQMPKENFVLHISPVFANGADTVYNGISSSGSLGFIPTSISSMESTGTSTKCDVVRPVGPKGDLIESSSNGVNGTIIMAVLFGVCFLIAAIVIKVYLSFTSPKKPVEVGSSNKQYVELAVPEKTTEGEVSGTYSKY